MRQKIQMLEETLEIYDARINDLSTEREEKEDAGVGVSLYDNILLQIFVKRERADNPLIKVRQEYRLLNMID